MIIILDVEIFRRETDAIKKNSKEKYMNKNIFNVYFFAVSKN